MEHNRETNSGRLFDPGGLFLVAVVGAGGGFLLLKHSWTLGLPMVALAALGLAFSHRHFNPPAE